MAIHYAGGTNIFKIVSGANKTAIADGVKGALVDAWWSITSGGSGDWILKTATTLQLLDVEVRIYNPGGANTCARVAFDYPGRKEWFLFADGTDFWVIANRYQFFILQNGVFSTEGTFVAGGVPYLDPFLEGIIKTEAWSMGNCFSDARGGLTSVPATWRTSDSCVIQVGAEDNSSGRAHVNGNIGTAGVNALRLMLKIGKTQPLGTDVAGTRWINDEDIKEGSRFAFGIINEDKPRIRGGLWDAVTVMGSYPGDTFTTFDSHTWMNVCHNYAGIGKASLWVVVPATSPTGP